MRHWILFLVIALFGAGIDLYSKTVVLDKVPFQEEIEIIPGYLSFGHIYNEGIVFGMFSDSKKIWLIVSILAVPIIVGVFASVKNPRWIYVVTMGLILAGTLGNLYDRAAYEKVRDFIKFTYDSKHVWPLFNLADSYICMGVLLLSVEMIFFDEKKKQKWKEKSRPDDTGTQNESRPVDPGRSDLPE
jgi:signal peptidase II